MERNDKYLALLKRRNMYEEILAEVEQHKKEVEEEERITRDTIYDINYQLWLLQRQPEAGRTGVYDHT